MVTAALLRWHCPDDDTLLHSLSTTPERWHCPGCNRQYDERGYPIGENTADLIQAMRDELAIHHRFVLACDALVVGYPDSPRLFTLVIPEVIDAYRAWKASVDGELVR